MEKLFGSGLRLTHVELEDSRVQIRNGLRYLIRKKAIPLTNILIFRFQFKILLRTWAMSSIDRPFVFQPNPAFSRDYKGLTTYLTRNLKWRSVLS